MKYTIEIRESEYDGGTWFALVSGGKVKPTTREGRTLTELANEIRHELVYRTETDA